LGCVDATLPLSLGEGEATMLAPCHPLHKKMTLVFGRARNDIYKIALNYSQIGQIYEVSQGNSH